MSVPRFAVDTSCMVAAVCGWHERHAAASRAIEARLDGGERMVVAAHALVEAYAVLTRLPAPHRLAPADAWAVLKASFADNAMVAALGGPAHVAFLEGLSRAGVRGGRSYDALIGASAKDGGAVTLLTLNARHFDQPPKGLAIVDPEGG